MNKNQLITSVIVLVILGVITFFTFKKDSTTWERGNEFEKRKLIEKLDVNKVVKLSITTDSGKLELEKDENAKWTVKNREGYPANFSKLRNFLMKLKNLTVVQEPRLLKNQFGSLKLEKPIKGTNNDNAGSLLELIDKDGNKMLSLIVGEQHFPEAKSTDFQGPAADGCYVLIEGTEKPALITNPLSIIDSDPKKWLDYDFIKIADMTSLSLRDTKGKLVYKIYRTDPSTPWILDGLNKGDTPLPRPMRDATSTFQNMNFEDVSSAEGVELKDAKTVTIETEKGMEYILKLLPKDKKVFAKIDIKPNLKPEKVTVKNTDPKIMEELKKKMDTKADKLIQTHKKERFYTQWLYEFPIYKIEKVLKDKEELYKTKL